MRNVCPSVRNTFVSQQSVRIFDKMKRTAVQDVGKRNAGNQYLPTDTKNLLFEKQPVTRTETHV
jgi:hypothetical protein